MDTGSRPATSTGNQFTKTPPLASASEGAENHSIPAQTMSVSASTLETLAEILSLIQEDCRRYQKALAMYMPGRLPVVLKFQGDGLIFISAPPGHTLGTGKEDTGKTHILLDDKPVTGYTAEGTLGIE